MERVMHFSERQTIQSVNARITALLTNTRRALSGEQEFGVVQVRDLSEPIQEMAPLVARASELRVAEPEISRELDLYTSQLRELHVALEQVRMMLLARRAQIDAGRTQLNAMSHWAAALRQTQ
jgi:hypothetical protein